MKFVECDLKGVFLIIPQVHEDERGYLIETYREVDFERIGCPRFVQDNLSRSKRRVLRGMHLQLEKPQGKLIRVAKGRIWDVVVDVDPASEAFGQSYGVELSEENRLALYVPPGFSHGFLTLSEVADVSYKCTSYYDPDTQIGLAWDDPDLALEWPEDDPILSARDRLNLSLPEFLAKLEARKL